MFLAFLSCILSRNSFCFVLFCVCVDVDGGGGLFMIKDVEHKPLYLISSRNWPTTSTLLAPGLLDAGHEQFIYVQEANIYV
jgi:hypothetical protein